jgi:hypothetical protein
MVNVNLQDKQQEFCDYYALANPIPNARAKAKGMHSCAKVLLYHRIATAEKHHVLLPSSHEDVAIMHLFTEFCSFSYFPSLRAKKEQLKAAIQTF